MDWTVMTGERPLDRLAEMAGISVGYTDALGKDHVIGDRTKIALLRAMHIEADSPDAIQASLQRLENEPWLRMTDAVSVVRVKRGARYTAAIALPADAMGVEWQFEMEDGTRRSGRSRFGDLPLIGSKDVDGRTIERRTLTLPFPVVMGRHRLMLRADDVAEEAILPVIAAPQRCHLPPHGANEDPRMWGLTLQLYGLRSQRNWGIGDFADLQRLADTVAPLGAAAIGLNPLHALFPQWPDHRSPYAPSHRRFLAVHYIAADALDDFAECDEARRMAQSDEFRQRLETARQAPLVDFAAVLALKRPIFDLLWRSFRERHLSRDDERARSFRAFQSKWGLSLRQFATFQALSEQYPHDHWRRWPEAYRDPKSADVARFAVERLEQVEFHEYLQWQAERQLKSADDRARGAGMKLGLYHDLALAPDGSGAEAWANPKLFASGASLGAPPDLWNQLGQNWGLPPYVPFAMRSDAYSQVSGVLRAIMERGGALRIDHAIGLERMFWIPEGMGPAEGGYVRYPVDELFAVIALESVREKSLVIGEDLGTLPAGFHKRMQSAGMLSYRLLYFEQDKRGEFITPGRYPEFATVAVTTHDLATLPGYWEARDLHVRDELKQFPSEDVKAASFNQREKDRRALMRALKREGLLPASVPDETPLTFEIMMAAYRFIARTPSLLMLLSIEDVASEKDQANLPGTLDEHPNWQRKLSLALERLTGDERLQRLARAINEERGRPNAEAARKDKAS
jgi:(1->4)-alpha-D-glucan 1-alpha-D-glucosylmutase